MILKMLAGCSAFDRDPANGSHRGLWRERESNPLPPGNEPGELPVLHLAIFISTNLSRSGSRCKIAT